MQVHIAKVHGVIFSGVADAVTVPGTEGELTILPHHIPLVTNLRSGTLTVRVKQEVICTQTITKGILEVHASGVTILL